MNAPPFILRRRPRFRPGRDREGGRSTEAGLGAEAGWLDVLMVLTESDLRSRFGRGPFQFIKWLVDPFALAGVYLLLVALVLDRPGPSPGLSLACAIVPFQLVTMSVISSLNAVTRRQAIILNMAFRRVLIPVSSVITETVALGASLLLLVMMMAIYGVGPTLMILWLPLVLLVNIVFAVAIAYPASLFGLWFVHMRNFATSFMRAIFFLAPGLVPLAAVPGRTQDLLRINPLTGIFESFRDIFLYGQSPAAWQLLYPLGFAAVLLAVFVPMYRREQAHFAKIVETG